MTMEAWEIKNKYIHTLHGFTVETVQKEWDEYRKRSTDDFAFVNYMILHKAKIEEKHRDRERNRHDLSRST